MEEEEEEEADGDDDDDDGGLILSSSAAALLALRARYRGSSPRRSEKPFVGSKSATRTRGHPAEADSQRSAPAVAPATEAEDESAPSSPLSSFIRHRLEMAAAPQATFVASTTRRSTRGGGSGSVGCGGGGGGTDCPPPPPEAPQELLLLALASRRNSDAVVPCERLESTTGDA